VKRCPEEYEKKICKNISPENYNQMNRYSIKWN